jgi:hypothetical protein
MAVLEEEVNVVGIYMMVVLEVEISLWTFDGGVGGGGQG